VKRQTYIPDPHQRFALAHLERNDRAALFLGMSLSKTVVVLTRLYELHYREAAILKTLVVAPDRVARITWPDELEKWEHLEGVRYSVICGTAEERKAALERDAEIYIIGVDNLVWLIDLYRGKLPFDGIVLDELSLFKSRSNKRFKKLRKAIKPIRYRTGLTGTPSPNGYIDLWSQICLLDDGERLGTTFGGFTDKYFRTRGNGMIVYEYIPREGAKHAINEKIKDLVLTMQTRDYLKLPDLHTVEVPLLFNEFDREIYDELEREYVADFFNGLEVTVKTPADLTNKLLQITSGAVYSEDGDWHEVNTLKIDALRELSEKHPDENFIIVYQYRHEAERIKNAFPFTRELRKGKKGTEDFRDWNAGKIRFLLIHPASAGHGLNLQFGGSRMVWFSLTWNLEHYQQTVARLLRRGQIKDIYVYLLIVRGTRDGKVWTAIAGKEKEQNFLFNEVKELRRKYGYE